MDTLFNLLEIITNMDVRSVEEKNLVYYKDEKQKNLLIYLLPYITISIHIQKQNTRMRTKNLQSHVLCMEILNNLQMPIYKEKVVKNAN